MSTNDSKTSTSIQIDWQRGKRTTVPEVIYAEFKSTAQIAQILQQHVDQEIAVLITRLYSDKFTELPHHLRAVLDYDEESYTAIAWLTKNQSATDHSQSTNTHCAPVGVLCAGTSDWPIAREVERTLEFLGVPSKMYADIGVAGLWRLVDIVGELNQLPVIIAIAGMEGALFSVVGGLVPCPVIAVPTSVGYGVSANGNTALQSALASCAPGVVTVNIDNGFGAAAAAVKMLTAATKNA